MSKSIKLFISYATEDYPIAFAIEQTLRQKFPDELSDVFLAAHSIRPADSIDAAINANLAAADALIVVSTGVEKASHSWTGFELGYFVASHSSEPKTGMRGKIFTFCLDQTLPAPVQNQRSISFGLNDSVLSLSEEEFLEQRKNDIKSTHDFVTFFGEIYDETHERGPKFSDRDDLQAKYRTAAISCMKEVFHEIKGRLKGVRKPQKQFVVRFKSESIGGLFQTVPQDAEITALGGAMDIFGVPDGELRAWQYPSNIRSTRVGSPNPDAKQISWKAFKAAVSAHSLGAHWCSALSKVILSGSGESKVDVDNSQVIASSDQQRLYRLVLTNISTYYNKEVEVSLYLVEALIRPDYGDVTTTRLLKGLQIVCRFRFLFMENLSEFHHLNIETLKNRPLHLPTAARSLVAELDLLHSLALQAELHRPASWLVYTQTETLTEMTARWSPIEAGIRAHCSDAMNAADDAETLSKLAVQLAEDLRQVPEALSQLNADLIKSMASKLSELSAAVR